MRRRPRGASRAAVAGLLLAAAEPRAGAAARPVGSAELYAGGGYDTNLFLQIAAVPESPVYRPYSGWFGRLYPAVMGGLAGESARLELRYGADIRQTVGSGTLLMQGARVGLTLPDLGPVSVRVAGVGGRFDATVDGNLAFFSAGGEADVTWRAAENLRLRVAYQIVRRMFGGPNIESDLAQTGEARAAWSRSPGFELGAGVAVLDLRSGTSRLQRAQGGLDASLMAGPRLGLFAAAWVAGYRLTATPDDAQGGGSVTASIRLGKGVDLVARYEALYDWRDYGRHIATAGVVAYASAIGRAPVGRPQEQSQAPEVQGRRVRFRARAAGASGVAVIGSWNQWSTVNPQQRLQRTRDPEMWEAWVALPPGDHRYHFLVDGHPVRPADSPQYRSDGFGNEDGVVTVGP